MWADKNYRATVPQSGCTLQWYHEVNLYRTQNLHANSFGEYIQFAYYSFRGTHNIAVILPCHGCSS